MKAIFLRAGIVIIMFSILVPGGQWARLASELQAAEKAVELTGRAFQEDQRTFGYTSTPMGSREIVYRAYGEALERQESLREQRAEVLHRAWLWPLAALTGWLLLGWICWGQSFFRRSP